MAIAFRIAALAALGLSGTAFAQGVSGNTAEEMPTLSDCLCQSARRLRKPDAPPRRPASGRRVPWSQRRTRGPLRPG